MIFVGEAEALMAQVDRLLARVGMERAVSDDGALARLVAHLGERMQRAAGLCQSLRAPELSGTGF